MFVSGNTSPCHHSLHLFAKTDESQHAGVVQKLSDQALKKWREQPDIESRRLTGGVGYIVIRSFADNATIDAFDKALENLRDAPGLIIDVQDNGGGDTAVARPIMGRFITKRMPYALMRRREGLGLSAPWTEYVEPKGPFTYRKPVVVLTSHWSGSMAEGFPMGMRDIGRATIVGTKMMVRNPTGLLSVASKHGRGIFRLIVQMAASGRRVPKADILH